MDELRDYQKEAVMRIFEYFKRGKNAGLVILPTGAGKSHVISAFTHYSNKNCLILQPTKEILEQNLKKLELYNIACSVFSASLNRREIGKITLATIGSLIKSLDTLTEFSYLIIDECDLVNPQGGMYEKLIKHLLTQNNIKFFGLTATPYRQHQTEEGTIMKFLTRTRPKIFQELIYNCNPSLLFDGGYLTRCKYYNYESLFNVDKILKNTIGSDYNEKALIAYETLIGFEDEITDAIEEQLKISHSILCFTSSINISEIVCKKINNPQVVTLTGFMKPKERDEIINNFILGKIKCIINVGVLSVGFDFPRLDCIILARPTLSLRVYYQQVGRGLRIHKDKKVCRVIDMVGNYKRFGRIEDLKLVLEKEDSKLYTIYSKTFNKQLTNVTI